MQYKPDDLFRGAAPYYGRYRPGYPPQFFAEIRKRLGLNGTQQVLDLGCGTGQIAIPLAPSVATVFAVDPDLDMLAEGRHSASDARNIEWLHGDSHHLNSLNLPPLDAVMMGKSFHWTDRAALLSDLDTVIRPHGAVVVVTGELHDAATDAPWSDVVATVRAKYLGPRRRAGSGTYRRAEEPHFEVLARSPFRNVETLGWKWNIERDIDAIVGLQFSYSYSSPAQFGSEERRAAFAAELRAALVSQYPTGVVTEPHTIEALIAIRPN
ncbi:class I SAM-dependent methyltransferase [Nocardia sp. NPDC059240]|uniref:class I SAM-dependent methyltransferase n=1 Tax=Nocardia sp. NPDC059240 TaxID=3346786 RepID=UPI0036A8D61F